MWWVGGWVGSHLEVLELRGVLAKAQGVEVVVAWRGGWVGGWMGGWMGRGGPWLRAALSRVGGLVGMRRSEWCGWVGGWVVCLVKRQVGGGVGGVGGGWKDDLPG